MALLALEIWKRASMLTDTARSGTSAIRVV